MREREGRNGGDDEDGDVNCFNDEVGSGVQEEKPAWVSGHGDGPEVCRGSGSASWLGWQCSLGLLLLLAVLLVCSYYTCTSSSSITSTYSYPD